MTNIEISMLKLQRMFSFFNEVYLFGSSLNSNKYPNDIDLLLIYEEYSHKVLDEKEKISENLENLFKKHIDLTILSKTELYETKFLERLNTPYRRIL